LSLFPALCCALLLAPGWAAQDAKEEPRPSPGQAEARDSEPAAPAPRAVVETREIDLGQVVRGESAEARFELRNDGDEVLRVLRAKPG